MGRIIILGGSSFLGRRLIQDFIELKINVIATSRKPIQDSVSSSDFLTWHLCDPQNQTALEELIKTGDTIINLIYAGVSDIDSAIINNLIEIDKKVKLNKLIHISTACLGEVAQSSIINEESIYKPYSLYEIEKLFLENTLINSNISPRLIIIRPTVIFGPGGQNLITFIKKAKNKKHLRNFLSILIFGERNMNIIPVKSVSYLVINCITHKKKFPKILLASNNGEDFKMKDLINGIYKNFYGKPLFSFSLPIHISNLILSIFFRRDLYAEKSFVSLHKNFSPIALTKEELLEEITYTIREIEHEN